MDTNEALTEGVETARKRRSARESTTAGTGRATYSNHPFPAVFFHLYDFTLPWIEANLPRGARVLDVGCGTGLVARFIVERCAPREIIAFDIDPTAVAQARVCTGATVQVLQADAEDPLLLQTLGTFDVVFVRNTFHHFKCKDRFLRVAAELLLKPGGVLLLLDLDARSNFAVGGLGAYATLLLTGLRHYVTAWRILKSTKFLQAKPIRHHREADKRMLRQQGWYRFRDIKRNLLHLLPSAEVSRQSAFLGVGGCYCVRYRKPV